MVGWLRQTGERHFRPPLSRVLVKGYPFLAVSIPPGDRERRLRQGAGALTRRGIRRAVADPGLMDGEKLRELGLAPVDPLPLCLAKAGDMALFFLRQVPLRERRVALRGERASGPAWSLAHALCRETGELLLDFDRGGEELADSLRARYGAAPRPLGGETPQLTVELAPRPPMAGGRILKLWGEPDLAGMRLISPEPIPPDLEGLRLLTLLWETGRVSREEIPVAFALDRQEENPYNTH